MENVENFMNLHLTRNGNFCDTIFIPPATVYFQKISTLSLIFIVIGAVLTLLQFVFYVIEIVFVFKYISSERNHRTGQIAWLLGVYPVTSFLCIIGASVPRSMPITNMFILLYFSQLLFVFTQLIIDIFGGRTTMTCKVNGTMLKSGVCPCACCCACLPRIKPTLANIRRIEFMVYQVAIIRPILFFAFGTAWADAKGDVKAGNIIFQATSVVNFSSTLIAMYGYNLFARMAADPLKNFRIRTQMKFMQILMTLINLQGNVLAFLAGPHGPIFCDSVLPAPARANFFNFVLIPVECLILSLCTAWFLRPAVNAIFDLHPKRHPCDCAGSEINGMIENEKESTIDNGQVIIRGDDRYPSIRLFKPDSD